MTTRKLRICKYGERLSDGKCPKKPTSTSNTNNSRKLRTCKYGERLSDGKCPKKPTSTSTSNNSRKLRSCKYGERLSDGKCPKKETPKNNVKLEQEKEWLNELLDDYKEGDNNEIYIRLRNIAKKKYLKDEEVAEYQEKFFVNFIKNGESMNKYSNLYNKKLHDKLISLRRNSDPDFMLNLKT